MVGGLFIFPCPGQIWNLKFLVSVGGSVIFSCPGQNSRPNLKFKIYGGRVGHLSMSRLNPKFKILVRMGGQSSCLWSLEMFMSRPNLKFKNFREFVPGQIQNLKLSVGLGDWASFHVQAQILNLKTFGEGGGQSSFHVQVKIWNLKFSVRFVGVSHLSMSRPNLKLGKIWKNFIEGWSSQL